MSLIITRRNVGSRKASRLSSVLALSIAVLLSSRVQACPYLTHTVPADRIAALSGGFNADGWISGPRPAPPADSLLRELRQAGMTHVRLPVPAEYIMPLFASKAERDERLQAVDRALTKLTSLGYYVSLDLHPGSRFNHLHRQEPLA
jgi:endoglucanase